MSELFTMLFEKDQQEKRLQNVCPGVMLGKVKKNWDSEHEGMVLVEFFLGEEGKSTSNSIPVMQPYANNSCGFYFLPEVNSVVVVGFLLGNLDSPIVLGCIWDKVNQLPENMANDKNSIKSILTKGGHKLEFNETENEEKIEITTAGGMCISLEDKDQILTMKDKEGENLCTMNGKDGSITVEAKKKIVLKADGKEMLTLDGTGKKASLEADTIEISAGQALTLKGQSTKLEGNMVEMKSQGSFKVESSAMLELKGSMTKIN